MTEAAIPIVALVVLIGLSYFLFGDAGAKGPNQVALVLAAMIGLVIGRRAGYTMDERTADIDGEQHRAALAF